jgi:hypothetical protein
MPTTDKPANYVKLTAFGPPELHDSEAVSIAPNRARKDGCAVSWVYPFSSKVEGVLALTRAQAKRQEIADKFPALSPDALQLSTYKSSSLRGVPVQGVSIRPMVFEGVAE